MAEDVNNESSSSKVEERKIVVEFCQLQEKSRQLFNALRYYFFNVSRVVSHLQARFVVRLISLHGGRVSVCMPPIASRLFWQPSYIFTPRYIYIFR